MAAVQSAGRRRSRRKKERKKERQKEEDSKIGNSLFLCHLAYVATD